MPAGLPIDDYYGQNGDMYESSYEYGAIDTTVPTSSLWDSLANFFRGLTVYATNDGISGAHANLWGADFYYNSGGKNSSDNPPGASQSNYSFLIILALLFLVVFLIMRKR